MAQEITVTYDATNMVLEMNRPTAQIRMGERIDWIFRGLPKGFSPSILFRIEEDRTSSRYFGPFDAVTQQIVGSDDLVDRVFGWVSYEEQRSYEYRLMIQKGIDEDPFEEPYGNSPDSVGKAVIISPWGRLEKVDDVVVEDPPRPEYFEDKIQAAMALEPKGRGFTPAVALEDPVKVIPITERVVDGRKELVIHDNYLFVRRTKSDVVVFGFETINRHEGWFPKLDFIGGTEDMAYDSIENMHFGPFSTRTHTNGKVIGTGRGPTPGGYHYRVAMLQASSGRVAFKSSPDPVVSDEEADYDD